ncbi:MAG: FtsB family cell division protein [Planctomycetota bacterium]
MGNNGGGRRGPWTRTLLHVKGFLLLSALAALLYAYLYLPAQSRSAEAEERVERLRTEVHRLQKRLSTLENRRDALEAGQPAAIEDAIRAELGWGRPGERVLVLPEDMAETDSERTERER